jgi:hypothetical protein
VQPLRRKLNFKILRRQGLQRVNTVIRRLCHCITVAVVAFVFLASFSLCTFRCIRHLVIPIFPQSVLFDIISIRSLETSRPL